MMPAHYKPLGKVYVWRIEGQAYYTQNREDSPLHAESGERYLVVMRDRQYEVISIDRASGGGDSLRVRAFQNCSAVKHFGGYSAPQRGSWVATAKVVLIGRVLKLTRRGTRWALREQIPHSPPRRMGDDPASWHMGD